MSNAMAPVPKDGPLMIAWEAYKLTDDYQNTRKWALHEKHVDGSLWAAFSEGFTRAMQPSVQGGDSVHSASELSERITELETALTLILPMAKGYAAANPVGSNLSYVLQAEMTLAAPVHSPFATSEPPDLTLGDWIPVSERLPEGGNAVLTAMVVSGNVALTGAQLVRVLYAEAQRTGETCAYTHWMPLPPPPSSRDALQTASGPNKQNVVSEREPNAKQE